VRGVIVALAVFALAVIPGASTARADVTPGYLLQDITVPEGDTVVQIPVTLTSPAPSSGVQLSYTEIDGTATSDPGGQFPPDYLHVNSSVFIPPGVTGWFIPIEILSDGIDENDETFTVQAFGNAIAIDPIATVTIIDVDLPPLLQWHADVSTLEGNSGSHTVSLTAELNRMSEKTIVANVQTADGTATGGTASPADYATATRQIVFQPGDTSETVSFDVFGDTNIEPTETFQARIVGATNAQLAGGRRFATITIVNDDDVTPPVIASRPGVFVQSVLSSVAVPYTPPTAIDAVDGPVPVTCSPASGSLFPNLTATTVTCSAQDRSGNIATSSFTVNVFHPLTIGAVTNPGDLSRPLTTVAPGQRVRVTAGGFAPGLDVTLVLLTASGAALPEGSTVAGADGRIDARPKIPDDAPLGGAQMTAVGIAPDGTDLFRAWHLTVGSD
jgi:hypothetical protein